ncbi:MAG: hypothetical protein H6686_07945 [Fibrobacteria bacterium]|nr:hypothetical protein [Fibrobacteria bacterium]
MLALSLLLAHVAATASGTPAGSDSASWARRVHLTIQVGELEGGMNRVQSLRSRFEAILLDAENNRAETWKKTATMEMGVPGDRLEVFKDSLLHLGEVVEFRQETVNRRDEIEKIVLELQFRRQQRDVYAAELASTNKSTESRIYHDLWEKAREIDGQIFRLEQNLLQARQEVRGNTIDLTLREASEVPTETSRRWVEFTNMPGGEFVWLSIENTKDGRSGSAYTGGSVRYLFTKGKSYLVLGVLKNVDDEIVRDTTTVRDIFQYGYGTDFYPSHFGRGKRNFLNLYSGFTLGGLFLSSKSENENVLFVSPHVGLELLKTRQLLVDVRGGYLLPLSSTWNLNLRGWTVHPAVNFVF